MLQARHLPQILAIDHRHRPVRRLKIVEQARVDSDLACRTVPTSIGFEIRAVGIEIATASAAEVVCHVLRIPTIDGVAVGLRHGELVGREIGIEMPPF